MEMQLLLLFTTGDSWTASNSNDGNLNLLVQLDLGNPASLLLLFREKDAGCRHRH